jgi:hypothetical protein
MTTDCSLAHSDAAYVLGSLSPADRLEFERHLSGCEPCRQSVAQLAGLPGLLGRVAREQVEAPLPFEPLPETVLPALVAAVRREQRRKAVLVTLGAAAAVAVVALGLGALQGARDDAREPTALPPATSSMPSSTPAPAHAMDVVVDYGVRAEVSLTQVKWGTKVGINCHYAEREGGYDGSHAYRYNLVVYTRNGKPDQVSSWRAKPGEAYVDEVITAAKLEQIARVEDQSSHGQTILRLTL